MSKTKEQKAKEKAAKQAAKQAVKETKTSSTTAETKTKIMPEKSAAKKKLDEKKAKETYLKEPLTSVQAGKLAGVITDMTVVRVSGTVADLQRQIPNWIHCLNELKI